MKLFFWIYLSGAWAARETAWLLGIGWRLERVELGYCGHVEWCTYRHTRTGETRLHIRGC
jgi:hypothetical protein